MEAWIAIAISVITLLGSIAAFIWERGRKDAKLDQIGDNISKVAIEVNARIDKVEQGVETVSADLAKHRENTSRHRDPERDESSHRELMGRLDKLESKLENMFMRLLNKID